ncbi:MAG: DUF3429 domain-containing protein [Pseudomonadales bacterium]|nr:DUF3429 domain-containing protein [Pseudomonadales bacterium]
MPSWQDRSVWVPALAYLGLMPFAACIVADQVFQAPLASQIFQVYGLAIATFLLGSWWGIALTRTTLGGMPWFEIGLSNALLILAVMIFLMPTVWGLLAQCGLFVVLLAVERWRLVFRSAPSYYQRMRRRVTVLVAMLHALMAALQMSAPG